MSSTSPLHYTIDQAIRFLPIYQERVWGGRDLARKLGRDYDPPEEKKGY